MSASKHWERRIPIYLIGMFLMTIGVNLSVLSGIGVSPIDTLPYIASLISQKSLGLCTTLVFSVYILLQIVILRRRFQWKNLLQIVLSIIFGWFVSLSGALTALLPQHPSYPIQFIYMLCSIVFLGSGIFLYVTADIMSMPADGVALALAEVSGKPMSSCKIIFDCTVVVLTVILSVTQLHNISGVREGTLIAAFGVGMCIRFWEKRMTQPLKAFLFGK
ncbi:YczE/YyaS/YitT family protein [Butyricicoccus intestinisimiae]|uniref:YitT family protein n=1 Tax=Butyricicoccus intestinisimiae TaxID=2841509 RepID=A0ABS6ESJ1_9FIRM|nr:hypothetical protein [Butyricicoccus intestinisimiae]